MHIIFILLYLIGTAYLGLGVRVLTYSIINRVPLKISPNLGEWAVMTFYALLAWPVALTMFNGLLKPALQPMNRRDRDRLEMQREVSNKEDEVQFSAQKLVHRKKMDELFNQQREIEDAATHHAITAAAPKREVDEDGVEEAELVEPEPPKLGKEALKMIHIADYATNQETYKKTWGIKGSDYWRNGIKRKGCDHHGINDMIECHSCSPVLVG